MPDIHQNIDILFPHQGWVAGLRICLLRKGGQKSKDAFDWTMETNIKNSTRLGRVFFVCPTNVDLADNQKIRFGAGNDLEIFHNASDSIINDAGTGSLKLQLGGSTKAEVVSGGFTITGTCTATAYAGDGSALTGVSSQVADGCITENSLTISNNYTMTTNKSGISAGDIIVASGVTVTIPSGSRYVIV